MRSHSIYLDVALRAVKKAGVVIRRYYHGEFHTEIKNGNFPVTIADREGEQAIVETIRNRFPHHRFLGEETGDSNTDSDYTWIIDPIDGTGSFSRRIPIFTIEIALMHGSEIVLGVSYAPILESLAYAEKGMGAYHNEQSLHVSCVNDLKEAYISYGGSMVRGNLMPQLLRLLSKTRYHVSGLHAWAHQLLAMGKLECALHAGINIWDVAAGIIIVEEAGGRCTDLGGNPITKNSKSFLLTNNLLHDSALGFFK